jgi:hypothetical protein
VVDWLPQVVVGSTFTLFGAIKLYGLFQGIEGGAQKPFVQRLCGTCPTWSRRWCFAFPFLLLVIGIGELVWAVRAR